MTARAPVVWLAFALLLLVLALFTQGEAFELPQLGWAALFAVPVAVSVLRGGLGDPRERQLQYPSIPLMVVGLWIVTVAPSLIVESSEARYVYHYSEASLTLARVFFFGWCLLFALVSGRARSGGPIPKPSLADFFALSLCALLFAGYLVKTGMFSFYRPGERISPGAGSTDAMASAIGIPLFMQLPPLLLLMSMLRARTRGPSFYLVLVSFLLSWGLLFLLGSRTMLTMGVGSCLLIARKLGQKVRTYVLVGLGATLPALLILLMVYRTALASSEFGVTSVGQYISIASEATISLEQTEAQTEALDMVVSNARIRFWYGQVFCVLIDQWLDAGAAMSGSLFAGVIAAVPTAIMSEKNSLAAELDFERMLQATHRFPAIDLPPTPWMQWLFELGILGLVLGALLYGWLASFMEARISKTSSFYEIFFWLQVLVCIFPAEHTTDVLVLMMRNALVLVLVVSGMARLFAWAGGLLLNPRVAHLDA